MIDKKIDILAIGDIATDVFIRIKEAEETCDPQSGHCKLCLNFGGKIPYESADISYAVGNSSNVAVSASRLGVSSALMANMGDDQNGIDCLNVLKKEKVDTTFIKIEKGKPTNYHYVLWYGDERTILVKHEKYEYEWTKTKESEEYHSPTWVYLSSLGENSIHFHDEIVNYLKRHTKVRLAFQPGTYQIKLGTDSLKEIYQRSEIFFSNKDEAKRILKTDEQNLQKLLHKIHDLGPKVVVITDGVDGAYSYDGKEILFMKSFPINPIESTGAGDAFSSAFMTAILLGKEIKDALIWGSANASSVMMQIGPHKGLLNKEQIEDYIKEWSNDYKPIKIN
jgi:sugar/nucleoside kinase (ribokinase family)